MSDEQASVAQTSAFEVCGSSLEAHPERAFWEIRASKTKGLWFKKRPKTLFPDASLVSRSQTYGQAAVLEISGYCKRRAAEPKTGGPRYTCPLAR